VAVIPRYDYVCKTCGRTLSTRIRLERLPGLLPHEDGGFYHYNATRSVMPDVMTQDDPEFAGWTLCGPMKRVWTYAGITPMEATNG
jgi:hypothetical protein